MHNQPVEKIHNWRIEIHTLYRLMEENFKIKLYGDDMGTIFYL